MSSLAVKDKKQACFILYLVSFLCMANGNFCKFKGCRSVYVEEVQTARGL